MSGRKQRGAGPGLAEAGRGLLHEYQSSGAEPVLTSAIEQLEQAVAAPWGGGDGDRARTLGLLSEALRMRYDLRGDEGDVEQALAIGEQAVTSAPADLVGISDLVRNLAWIWWSRFRHGADPEHAEQALATVGRAIDVAVPRSPALRDLFCDRAEMRLELYGLTADFLDLQRALEDATSVIVHSDASEPWGLRARLIAGAARGRLFEVSGRVDELELAAGVLDEAIAALPKGAPQRWEATVRLGTVYKNLYRATGLPAHLTTAGQCLRAAADEAEDDHSKGIALDSLANVLSERFGATHMPEDLHEAAQLSRQAAALVDPTSTDWVTCQLNLGADHWDLHRHGGEDGDLDAAVDAWRSAAEPGRANTGEFPKILGNLGNALAHRAARRHSRDDLQAAVTALEQALAALDERLAEMPISERLAEERRRRWIGSQLVGALLAQGNAERAFALGEGGKAALLRASLRRAPMQPPVGVAADLLEAERALLDDLDLQDAMELAAEASPHSTDYVGGMAVRFVGSGLGLIHPQSRVAAKAVSRARRQNELEELWDAMSAAQGDAAARYVAFRRGAPLTWHAVADSLRAFGDAAVLAVVSARTHDGDHRAADGNRQLAALVGHATWDGPRQLRTPLSLAAVQEMRARVERQVAHRPAAADAADDWDAALRPLLSEAAELVGKVSRLFVSAGPLGDVPWGAVVQRAGWGVGSEPLPIGLVPSVAALALLALDARVASAGRCLVVGNPTRDLDHAEEEARQVAAVWGATALLDGRATRKRVRGALGKSDVVHLAAHGRFDEDAPLRSGVDLADDRLTAEDMLAEHVHPQLVVLSGCETGRAETLPGEERVGLMEAFLRAGSRSLVVSLWRVDDEATGRLMQEFHQRVRGEEDLDRALAMAAASVRSQPRWSHPFFWAGFVLVGDPRAVPLVQR